MVKNLPASARDTGDMGLTWIGQTLEEEMITYYSILAWKQFHGQRAWSGHSSRSLKASDMG